MSLMQLAASPALEGAVGDSLKITATMEESLEFNQDLPYLVVTHEMPDTDAMSCIWFINRFLADGNAHVSYVRAGERLPIHEGTGYNVIHVDTGFGRFDQHDKRLNRGSSFQLLVEHFGYDDDPGIKPILELTRATDNVQKVDDCSVHNVFKALRGTVKTESGATDWDAILSHVFVTLNSLHSFHTKRAEGIAEFERIGKIEVLKNGLKIAQLGFHPYLRDAAFRKGADVALWFVHKGRNFFMGLQVREESSVRLGKVIVALRKEEASRRGISVPDCQLARFGTLSLLPTWFIHYSNQFLASGTNGHPLKKDEFSKLSRIEIERLVKTALSEK